MKNLLRFIVSASLLVAASSLANAQESGSPSFENYDTEELRERDVILTPPSNSDKKRPSTQVLQPRDSANTKTLPPRNAVKQTPAIPKDESKPRNQTDDSILSFNFLYYLIQKYKMQDILE